MTKANFILFSCLIFIFLIIGYFVNNKEESESEKEIIDKEFGNYIKGLAILSIVWSHVGARLGYNHIQSVAGVGVSMFLFLSGYGVSISYKKNGLKKWIINRLVSSCLLYWIVEVTWLVYLNEKSFIPYLKVFLFINPVTEWYMPFQMIWYIAFLMIVLLSNGFGIKKERTFILIAFATFIFVVFEIVHPYIEEMPYLRLRQMMAFPIGMMCSLFSEKAREIFLKIKWWWCVLIIFVTLGLNIVLQYNLLSTKLSILYRVISIFTIFPISLCAMYLLSVHRKMISNKMLSIIGKLSYLIFLVHMITLRFVDGTMHGLAMFLISTVVGVCPLYLLRKHLNYRIRKK